MDYSRFRENTTIYPAESRAFQNSVEPLTQLGQQRVAPLADSQRRLDELINFSRLMPFGSNLGAVQGELSDSGVVITLVRAVHEVIATS